METGQTETSKPEESATPIKTRAKVGPVPAAEWTCGSCGRRALSVVPKLVGALASGAELKMQCECGAVLLLQQSRIHTVGPAKPAIKRKPIIV